MGLLSLVEDRPTPKAVYNWRVYACAATAAFAAMMIGYDSAFIGTTLALPSFTAEFGFKELSKSELALVQANIVSVYQAGAFVGAIMAYAIAHYIGRQRGLAIFSVIFNIGAGMMLGASAERGLGLIYAGRVLAGIGVGGASMLTPIYISEISPPAIRGRLVGLYELGWQIGGLVGFWINYGIQQTIPNSTTSWHIPFAVQLIPGGLLTIGAFLIKESPRWLFFQSKREKALKNLCWIRQLEPTDVYMVEEVTQIESAIEYQRTTVGLGFTQPFKSAARDRQVLWRLFLGGMLFLWQNGSGLGITGTTTGFLTTGLFGIVKTVLTIVWLLFLIDHLGRRRLLMIGAAGGALCMFYIGGYLTIVPPSSEPGPLTAAGKSAIFFFYLWTAFYTPSWNGTPWVLNSELFQPNIRPLGQAFASMNNWFWNFIVARFTPQMFLTMGAGVYFFFASLMLASIVFVYFLLPETKAIPLEAMDKLFMVKPVRKANKTVLADLRQAEEHFRRASDGQEFKLAQEKIMEIENAEKVVVKRESRNWKVRDLAKYYRAFLSCADVLTGVGLYAGFLHTVGYLNSYLGGPGAWDATKIAAEDNAFLEPIRARIRAAYATQESR